MCLLGKKYKITITAEMPHVKDVSPYTFFQNPRAKKGMTETVHQGSPGAPIQPNIFQQKIIEKGFTKELHHVGLEMCGTAIKQGGLLRGGFEGDTVRQAVYFAFVVTAMDKNPDQK